MEKYKEIQAVYKWLEANIKYINSDMVESAEIVLKSKCGNSHSQSNLIVKLLDELGIECQRIFMIAYNNLKGIIGQTHITKIKPYEKFSETPPIHTTVFFKSDHRYYWIEHAWGVNNGLYGPFNSIKDMEDTICKIYNQVPRAMRYRALEFYYLDKGYENIEVQDYVYDIVNTNIRYRKVIWYPVYDREIPSAKSRKKGITR